MIARDFHFVKHMCAVFIRQMRDSVHLSGCMAIVVGGQPCAWADEM